MRKVLVGVGEILWDMLPSGKKLGGAPANFAFHAGKLGGEGMIVSFVCSRHGATPEIPEELKRLFI